MQNSTFHRKPDTLSSFWGMWGCIFGFFLGAILYGKSPELKPEEVDSNPKLSHISYLLVDLGEVNQPLSAFIWKMEIETEATHHTD